MTHVKKLSLESLEDLNLYLDAGTEDEFQFDIHTENFAQALLDRGLRVQIEDGFPEDFPQISHFYQNRVYVRYEGGHVGFNKENIGLSFRKVKQGVKGAILVANRFATLFNFVSNHFLVGNMGPTPMSYLGIQV